MIRTEIIVQDDLQFPMWNVPADIIPDIFWEPSETSCPDDVAKVKSNMCFPIAVIRAKPHDRWWTFQSSSIIPENDRRSLWTTTAVWRVLSSDQNGDKK